LKVLRRQHVPPQQDKFNGSHGLIHPCAGLFENHFIDPEMFSQEEVPPATGSGSRLGSAVVIVAG